jgi:monodechloroaminopyrrolnitrin synthase
VSLPGLCHAISLATRIGQLSLTDDEFPATVYEMTHALQGMIDSIQLVRDRVSPEWFAITLRPYFDTVAVNGIDLLGPAAANLPLGLIDILIWASDYADQDYTEFCGEISRYSPPEWRGLYPIWSRQPSLVKRVTTAITEGHGSARDLQRAADAVSAALRVLLIWRGRHFTVARRAYSDNARWHPVGSAGGSIGLLSSILNLTRQNATRVASSAPQHHETTGRPQRGKKRQ